ncbi:MAB_1171c family putative transporter [Streptomyces sp. 8N114]|uniref:MAB_1171c family putative transporter n=1 Tax=Streptomyces sp. 8N114 TaxID=3457419 RepID=UPI003FD0083D
MSAETADLGNFLTYPSVVILWVAVLIRFPSAVHSPKQRGLWLAVATAATAMTLALPRVAAFAMKGSGIAHSLALTRNLIGVVSAGAVLYFVAVSTGSRRRKLGFFVTVSLVMTALLVLDTLAPPHQEHDVPAAEGFPPSLAYWVTLISAHLLANTVCAFVCLRYSRRTENLGLAVGLRLFGLGTVLVGLFWLGYLLLVTANSTWVLPLLPLLMSLHGLLRAAAILVPTLFTLRHTAADIAAAWRLWPLWRDLVQVVPHVALTKPRARLVELLWPPIPHNLLLYRKVIETRDAILILNDYVEPQVPDLARCHVSITGVANSGREEAAVLACVIREARRAKTVGRPQQLSSFNTCAFAGSDLEGEKRFLIDVADAYGSASTRTFEPQLWK